jgi:hypothetical protein
MKFFIFLLSLLLFSNVFSQHDKSVLSYDYPDELPLKYKVDIDDDTKKYFENHPELKGEELEVNYVLDLKKLYKAFFESTLSAKNEKLETYLTNILKRIVPDSIIKQNDLRIYVSKVDGVNASAGEDGTIIFNIYNFIYFNNEAEIAFVLAHEVAHVLEKNGVDLMVLYNHLKKNPVKRRITKFEEASKHSEMMADKVACEFLEISNYNSRAGVKVFDLFEQIEKQYNFVNVEVRRRSLYMQTHPYSKNRRDSVAKWTDLNNGESFLEDKSFFKQVNEEVVVYMLKFLMDNQQYRSCVELALGEYFFNKDRKMVYYILEPLRRLLLEDKKLANKPLLSETYRVGQNYTIPFHSNKIFIKPCDSLVMYPIRKKRVYSYKGYMDYFVNVAITEKIEDCILPIGLYSYKKGGENDFLVKYNASGEKKYSNFVAYLLGPEKNQLNVNGELFVQNEIHFTRYNRYGFPIDFKKQEDTLAGAFDHFVNTRYIKMEKDENSFVSLSELKKKEFNHYYQLKKIFSFFRYVDDAKINTKKSSLYLLNPDLWEYLYQNNISKIDFLDMFKVRNGQKALQIIAASQGISTGPIWVYSVTYYSHQTSGVTKIKSYDVGSSIRKRQAYYVLSNYIFNEKNFPINE